MRSVFFLAIGLFLALAASCAVAGDVGRNDAQCLSVDDALAQVGALNGTPVAICGWLRYESEDKNLYATATDRWEDSDDHCLSVGRSEGFTTDLASLSGRRVRVTGVATSSFCPADTICMASCSSTGIFAQSIDPL